MKEKRILKLKKLLLYGFKSFADKTTIEFKNGLTAIVGPNGCGKSNVVDALRWVMGETRSKAIRGENMHDVLFNGTKTRAKTSYAEVSLVFDEINGTLAVPYDEVMITRRLFADGTSGYFLNKKEVRLKDLHALFANTGIGKNAFWVFEQGKIDQIVTMSPPELRTIFEDASGISLYLFQKKEAKSRLKEVEQNLLRATDRVAEKEKFIAMLRKQKEDAETYKRTKNELELHEKGLFFKRLKLFDSKIEDLKKSEGELCAQGIERDALFQEKEELLKRGEERVQEQQKIKEEKKEHLLQLKSDLALLEGQKGHLEKEIHEKEGRKASLSQTLITLEHQLEEFNNKHPVSVRQFKEVEARQESLQTQTDEEKSALKKLEQQVSDSLQKERQNQESLFLLQQAIQKGQFDLNTLELKKENSLKEHAECQMALTALLASLEARGLKKNSQQEEMNALRLEFEAVKVELKEKQGILFALDQHIGQIDQKIEAEMKKSAEIQAKINSLNALKSELEGASLGTKELYKVHPDLKPLSELIDVDPEFAEAVANALHPYSHTLVANDDEALDQALEYIKTHRLTNISLISRTSLHSTTLNANSLASLCSPQDLSIHFFNDISIKESSQEYPRWTQDGFWITVKKLITRTKMGEQNAFMRQGEIKKLGKELDKQLMQKEAAQTEKGSLIRQKEENSLQIKEIEAKLKQKEIKLMELKFHLQNETESFKKEEERKNSLIQKMAQLNTQILPIDAQKEKLHLELGQQEALAKETSEALDLLKKELELSKELLSKKRYSLQSFEKDLFTQLSKKEALKSEIQSSIYKQQQQLKQQEQIQSEIKEMDTYLQTSKSQLRELPLELLKKQLDESEHLYQEQCKLFEETVIHHQEMKEEFKRLIQEAASLKESLKDVEMKLFEQNVRKSALINEHHEKYGTYDLEQPSFELSLDKYEQKIKELRSILANLPSINPQAGDEHAIEEQEMVNLQAQIHDLQGSMQEVLKLIGDLDHKSSSLFQETFKSVAHNFQKNFQTLFHGGNAELVLKERGDLLEAEVEIKCEPPGKTLKSLQLLSGGEKCLTAIALLFALFQVKPAPMCLLDEIDAPLDESNARRFLDLIEPFANQTKIILVTHNKLTMERAHQLIGISMQEKGVTKVIDLAGLQVEVEEDLSVI